MASQGETYAAFIAGELAREHERRTALDTRATSVAASSSGFIAVAGALTVLVTDKDFTFSPAGARGLLLSLVSFLVAASVGMLAHGSRRYEVTKGSTLQAMIGPDHWSDSEVTARNQVAWANLQTTRSLRRGNNRKAGQLVVSHIFQLAGTAGFIVTLAYELRHHLL